MREVPVRIGITIEEATAEWLSRYSSANTRAAYLSDLKAFLSWYGDDEAALAATPEIVSEYRAEREASGVSEGTVNRQFTALRAFFTSAYELGLRDDNPFGTRPGANERPSTTGTLSPRDVARLEEAATEDPRTAVLVQLLLGQGMRLAEILGLDHGDVSGSRQAKRLRVVRHGDAVVIPLDRSASRSMATLERTTFAPGPLFVGPSRGRSGATRLTRFGADHLLKQAAASANIQQPVSANVLRRTHVSIAQREGVSLDDIRQTMGHRDVRTTRRYLDPAGPHNLTHNPERS